MFFNKQLNDDEGSALDQQQRSPPITFLYSNLGSFLPEPLIGLIQEYYVDPKEVAKFLKQVTEGKQDQAEAMLKGNPALALAPGDVIDLAKRTFKGITAFQYAVWALDWHMWTMIQKYLPDTAAQEQVGEFETGAWVKQHGVHAQYLLDNLVKALQTIIDLYNAKKYAECDTAWVQQVGDAQCILPAHVINEYCHPTRSFYPLPNFRDTAPLPRTQKVDGGEWNTDESNGGKLGVVSAVWRGQAGGAVMGSLKHSTVRDYLAGDFDSVRALSCTRVAQREELITNLRSKKRKAA